jgi:multidrug efflux pump subunit AcrA (membrane-fusion protein)
MPPERVAKLSGLTISTIDPDELEELLTEVRAAQADRARADASEATLSELRKATAALLPEWSERVKKAETQARDAIAAQSAELEALCAELLDTQISILAEVDALPPTPMLERISRSDLRRIVGKKIHALRSEIAARPRTGYNCPKCGSWRISKSGHCPGCGTDIESLRAENAAMRRVCDAAEDVQHDGWGVGALKEALAALPTAAHRAPVPVDVGAGAGPVSLSLEAAQAALDDAERKGGE